MKNIVEQYLKKKISILGATRKNEATIKVT